MTLEQLYQFKLVRILLGGTWVKRDGVWHRAWAFSMRVVGASYLMHKEGLTYVSYHGTNRSIEAMETW